MTRGVNMCTILALRKVVGIQDIEPLARLLESNSAIYRLAAGYVLSVLGPSGIEALKSRGSRLGEVEVSGMVRESAGTQKSLASYESRHSCRKLRVLHRNPNAA
jgi:hypothetical protein